MNNLPATQGYQSVIERAALDPNFDVDKLERLVAMQEAQEQRAGDAHFNEMLAKAQAEMLPISANAINPQARSRYATHAKLDSEARPIYTKYGFGVSFNTEPLSDPNWVRVVAYLSNGVIVRRYEYDAAIETTGAKGTQYTTRQWAKSGAVTYAKRQLLAMIFNLSVDPDTDGAAARRPPPVNQARNTQAQTQAQPFELTDPETGEVIDKPAAVAFTAQDDYGTWGQRFLGAVRNLSATIDDIDRWVELNHDTLSKMEKDKPAHFDVLRSRINEIKEGLGDAVRA
ncbi:hypothetical protein ABIG06_006281 [Bradyrhizobium sp. USDA 326]|uniref:ERF family protein n=1 Tax=unclassified Bradyrhizobium TaxID=2631580 RepID=UPI0035138444